MGGENLFELKELRERRQIFRDRAHAGEVLAGMLTALKSHDPLVLGIPAGGSPAGPKNDQSSRYFSIRRLRNAFSPWLMETL
ncbi:hypothetical protein SAMN05660860_03221 [Geoalkalibacter ferrihydriticus]|uniref:Uncharacterized protein n=1 Tax=Geoalkalibacter ferrihydriticus TaxID=392333 RepID=A0A1G9WA91_9BACT|nr:hypothetical protein [Geoalkalibacter ferrihydriticus]SDM81432.1 hypothetical protein SAMN05660860_03221 [Geoalkalibacter ferrihydriticus]